MNHQPLNIPMNPLTPVEIQTIEYIVLGWTEKEIAAKRKRSLHTIRRQVRSAMAKTGSCKQTDLVRWWFVKETGIDLNPLKRRLMAGFALLMLVFAELCTDNDYLRARKTGKRTVKTMRVRRGKRNEDNNYYLT